MAIRSAVLAAVGALVGSCAQADGGAAENARAREAVANEAQAAPREGEANAPTEAAQERRSGASTTVAKAPQAGPAHPCRYQDDRPIPAMHLRALGTEPFWAARIDGRCVTYSTPEDQEGTRVWTRFSGSAERGEWNGYLGRDRFILHTRPEQGCSDGMSDKRYPVAVSLTVRGEQRTGCAEPL